MRSPSQANTSCASALCDAICRRVGNGKPSRHCGSQGVRRASQCAFTHLMGACVQDRGEILALELKFLQAGFISKFIPRVIVYAAHEMFEEVNDMIKKAVASAVFRVMVCLCALPCCAKCFVDCSGKGGVVIIYKGFKSARRPVFGLMQLFPSHIHNKPSRQTALQSGG